MPKKRGNGGNGPEEFDPTTGKYVADGQPNKYYDNKNESLIANIANKGAIDQNISFTDNNDDDEDFDDMPLSDEEFNEIFVPLTEEELLAETKYKGKGKEILRNALYEKLCNEYGALSPYANLLLECFENADDELSGIIGNLISQFEMCKIIVGDNVPTQFAPGIFIGHASNIGKTAQPTVSFNSNGLSESAKLSQTKSEHLFHEMGHFLDANYVGTNGWVSPFERYSYSFRSQKYGTTLCETIYHEINANVNIETLKQEIDKSADQFLQESNFYELQALAKRINKQLYSLKEKFHYSDEYLEKSKELEDIENKADGLFYQGKLYEAIQLFDLHTKKAEELEEFEQQHLKNDPVFQQLTKQYGKIIQQQDETKTDVSRRLAAMYSSFNDMIQASLGEDKCIVGLGHEKGYYDGQIGEMRRGKEAFAEIMAAKACHNNECLKVFKQYIPKTLEIFDEIIENIKGTK